MAANRIASVPTAMQMPIAHDTYCSARLQPLIVYMGPSWVVKCGGGAADSAFLRVRLDRVAADSEGGAHTGARWAARRWGAACCRSGAFRGGAAAWHSGRRALRYRHAEAWRIAEGPRGGVTSGRRGVAAAALPRQGVYQGGELPRSRQGRRRCG